MVCAQGGPIYGQHSLVVQWMEYPVTQAGILGLQSLLSLFLCVCVCMCVCVSYLALIPPPKYRVDQKVSSGFPI